MWGGAVREHAICGRALSHLLSFSFFLSYHTSFPPSLAALTPPDRDVAPSTSRTIGCCTANLLQGERDRERETEGETEREPEKERERERETERESMAFDGETGEWKDTCPLM